MDNSNTIKESGAIILSSTNSHLVALLYRAKYKDWSFPKGHIEPNEDAFQTLKREVKEETSLDVELLVLLPDYQYTEPNGVVNKIYMYLMKASVDSITKPESDGDKIEWVKIDEVYDKLSYDDLKNYFKSVQLEVMRYIK